MQAGYRADVSEVFEYEGGKAKRGHLTLARLRELERYCYQMRQE